MSKVKEILRLKDLGFNQSEIAKGAGVSRATVQDYLRRAHALGVGMKEVESCTEEELLVLLGKKTQTSKRKVEPDYHYISRELNRKGVTLSLLWEESIEQHPGGISYSGYCNNYRQW